MIESLENRRVLANFEVTSLGDVTVPDSEVTLREAIVLANADPGADTITFTSWLFAGGSSTIVLTQGELAITESVTITGPGQTLLTINANQQSRVLNVIGGTPIDVTLQGLTLTGGRTTGSNTFPETTHNGGGVRFDSSGTLTLTGSTVSGNSTAGSNADGGGIFASSGAVTLTGSTVSGNSTAGDGASGGGIFASSGAVTLTGSTVSGNSTAGNYADGGGIFARYGAVTLTGSTVSGNSTAGSSAHGGGIFTRYGAVTLTGSTVSGNRLTGTNSDGGGVWFDDSVVTIVNSTVTGNSATRAGGGLGMLADSPDKKLTIHNSIIAGNTATGSNPDFTAPVTPGTNLEVRFSLIGNNEGTTLTAAATADANGNLIGAPGAVIDPKLGPLAFNGGPTQTHGLLDGSPAINAGDNNRVAGQINDQRGVPFIRIANTTVDMGAYERQTLAASFFIVTTLADELDYTNGVVSLREALNSANGSVGTDTITFAPSLFTSGSGSIVLTLGQLQITDSVTLTGPGSNLLTIDAGENSRHIRISDDSVALIDVTLANLTLTRGNNRGIESGGAILSRENVTILNSTISGSVATVINFGGGIFHHNGLMTIRNSTISGNTAFSGGAIINYPGVGMVIENTTISGNQETGYSGGGIFNQAPLTILNSTITNNISDHSGGIFSRYIDPANLVIRNSIIAGNRTPGGTPSDLRGTVPTITHSLVGSNNQIDLTAAATADANGNLIGAPGAVIDPKLGPLALNGGPTQTHALLDGSPAINAGDNNQVAGQINDQRGVPFMRIANTTVDMGAYERQTLDSTFFIVTTLADELDYTNTAVSLREALNSANGSVGTDTITFDASLFSSDPGSIVLTQGQGKSPNRSQSRVRGRNG